MESTNKEFHKIILTNRENLVLTNVDKVVSSNVNNICVQLKDSDLIIAGSNLCIDNFNEKTINITGIIDCLKYTKLGKKKEGFFKRIFK